jgi:hypothetical protein
MAHGSFRTDLHGINLIGKFDLNLFHIPGISSDGHHPAYDIAEMIAGLVPKSVYIPLSLDVLNKEVFCPQKKDDERLNYGRLQLSRDTHLVFDETLLKEGKLNDQGIYYIYI